MYPSRFTGYQDPLSWTFSKKNSAPIYDLVIFNPVAKVKIFITLGDLQAPYVCVIPWLSSELVQGLLSFAHMIMPVMCIYSGCKCLFIVYAFFSWEASCYEYFLVSHNVSIYCMMELQTSLHVSILHPRQWFFLNWSSLSSWLLFHSWKVLHQWCCCIRHIILHLELSSLVIWNKSHPSLLVGDYSRYFLQVKCICMVRNIS